jgi:hypothetical protein
MNPKTLQLQAFFETKNDHLHCDVRWDVEAEHNPIEHCSILSGSGSRGVSKLTRTLIRYSAFDRYLMMLSARGFDFKTILT